MQSGQSKHDGLISPVLTLKRPPPPSHSAALALGLYSFGQGHPGCNYRFTAGVFLPGLEILKGGSRGCPHCGGGGGGGSGKRGRDL